MTWDDQKCTACSAVMTGIGTLLFCPKCNNDKSAIKSVTSLKSGTIVHCKLRIRATGLVGLAKDSQTLKTDSDDPLIYKVKIGRAIDLDEFFPYNITDILPTGPVYECELIAFIEPEYKEIHNGSWAVCHADIVEVFK